MAASVHSLKIPFENTYANLPERFYAKLAPKPVKQPQLIKLNHELAIELGLDPATLNSAEAIEMFAGNALPDSAEPLAMAYAGHQFGNWVPQLGDGRAILLGELRGKDGIRRDVQLKGSGRTPFSRMGDGRAVLGPVLREYIVSEAMHALGIPTTRALAAVTTGEIVLREAPMQGAILTRVAKAHVRVGTFQYFASKGDTEGLAALSTFMIERCYPGCADQPNQHLALLQQVIRAQANLIADWLGAGFIHGVMNTDNMSIAGETIDFGPCAFMDAFDPGKVFSSIDEMGRYAFMRQPDIAHWNLACLARAMLPIIDDNEEAAIEAAQAALDTFPDRFKSAWLSKIRKKLGLFAEDEADETLGHEFLRLLHAHNLDFTNTFRDLSSVLEQEDQMLTLLGRDAKSREWINKFQARHRRETKSLDERRTLMNVTNPAVIPRNHQVERAIQMANSGSFEAFEALHAILQTPYEDVGEDNPYRQPPAPGEAVLQTFCGT